MLNEHNDSHALPNVKIKGSIVEFHEVRGGTLGTEYFYVEVNGELIHVAQLPGARELPSFPYKRGKKWCSVEVPLNVLKGSIYRFYFTNRENLSAYRCYISESEVKADSIDLKEVINLSFRPLGNEGIFIDQYKDIIPKMASEIGEIKRRKDFAICFYGQAERTYEAISDPNFSLFTSMILPSANSRIRSLKAKIQSVHEIWCMQKVIDFLDAEVEKPFVISQDRCLRIATAQERPACYLRTPYGEFTLWYQFPIIDQFTAVVLGAGSRERIHVRPDIVLFPGRIEKAEDIRGPQEARITKKALVIDARTEVKEEDIKQLKDYVKFFTPGSRFMALCLNELNSWTKAQLKASGWDVFEDIAPDKSLSELKEGIVKALAEIKVLN